MKLKEIDNFQRARTSRTDPSLVGILLARAFGLSVAAAQAGKRRLRFNPASFDPSKASRTSDAGAALSRPPVTGEMAEPRVEAAPFQLLPTARFRCRLAAGPAGPAGARLGCAKL